nr:MAG TPA: Tail tape measure [Caudoviricetes sp.]
MDRVSGPLRNMYRAMTTVVTGFEEMQKASGKAVNTATIQKAKIQLNEVAASILDIESNTKRSISSQRRHNDEIRNGANAAAGLAGKIKSVVAMYAGAQGTKGLLSLADTMTTTKARLDLMNDGLQKTEELQNKIMESANRSRASYQTTADAVSKMGIMAADAFNSNEEIIQFTELLNKQFTIAGTSAEGIDAAMLQLTQAMGSGVLRGEEFNAVFEQAPTIMQTIADHMGVPIGKLREMASNGQITAEIVKNAMLSSAGRINEKFNSMPMTFTQVWELAKNAILNAFMPVISFIGQMAQFIYDNWSIIGPIFYGLATAVLVYAAALGIQTIATKLVDLATQGFFKTLLTNPLFWVAIAIGVVIAALIWWVKACGGIKAAWLTMCNWVLMAWDWVKIGVMTGAYYIMDLWDQLVKSTMWLGMQIQNICGDMKAGTLKIIQDMCNGAIDIINAFIAALNWIPGVSIEFIDHVTFGTTAQLENDAAKQAREADYADYEADIAKASQDRWNQIDQWKSEALANQQMREAEIAAAREEANRPADDPMQGIANQIGQMSGQGTSPYSDTLGGIAADTGNIANSTSGIADSLDITQEDLQYLRDLAEQEVINRFTTAEIKIDMTNNNNINSSTDIDGIVDALTTKVQEALVSTAEGVH